MFIKTIHSLKVCLVGAPLEENSNNCYFTGVKCLKLDYHWVANYKQMGEGLERLFMSWTFLFITDGMLEYGFARPVHMEVVRLRT